MPAAPVLGSGVAVASAVARGVWFVVLEAGDEGGCRAYEAARALNGAVGDRAYLLIAERVDVASAEISTHGGGAVPRPSDRRKDAQLPKTEGRRRLPEREGRRQPAREGWRRVSDLRMFSAGR
jgi:hypothetical protein